MTHGAARHRDLDRAAARAMGEAPGHALMRSRDRLKDQRTMASARVLLTTLSVRQSARGNAYLTGWLGKSRVVAFSGEPDRHGNQTWDIFAEQPEPRDGPSAGRQRAPATEAARERTEHPPSAGGRPGASRTPLRPEPGPGDEPPSPATFTSKDSTRTI